MRNILEHVRKRDYDEVNRGAQAIYRADCRLSGPSRLTHLPSALAAGVRCPGAAARSRPAGVALFL
jgi:transposase-like protein